MRNMTISLFRLDFDALEKVIPVSVAAIIAEYNPLHNGHLWHLQETRRQTGARHILIIMSGAFTQRGEPAVVNKWARAAMALSAGADVVLELPAAFAVQPAQTFAAGAVSLLQATRVVQWLSFGTELGRLDELRNLAHFMRQEHVALRAYLQEELARGHSFPRARAAAILRYHSQKGIPGLHHLTWSGLESILHSPNNVLGLEYLQALQRKNSTIQPLALPRQVAAFHDTALPPGNIASATAIRRQLHTSGASWPHILRSYVPPEACSMLEKEIRECRGPVGWDAFTHLLLGKLMSLEPAQLASLPGMEEGLEKRLRAAAADSDSVSQLLQKTKTRRYTLTRLQRLAVYLLWGFYGRDHWLLVNPPRPLYLRVLGFSQSGRNLLRQVKSEATAPLVIRPSRHLAPLFSRSHALERSWRLDCLATDLFTRAYPGANHTAGQDYTHSPVYYRD